MTYVFPTTLIIFFENSLILEVYGPFLYLSLPLKNY